MSNTDKTKETLKTVTQQLTATEQQLSAVNQQLEANNQQLIAEKQEIEKYVQTLGERVKELNCFYSISESVRTKETFEEILQDIINVIPPAWQYPEITCVKISLWNKEYKTDNYKNSKWVLSSDITVNQKIVGKIEVCVLEQKLRSNVEPFLNEEIFLLDTITERLGKIIQRKQTEDKIKAINQQLEANNQQLIAGEQQLRAANQQLEANNQQLIAGEQQLRAANQQLMASENSLKTEKEFSENLLETANTFIVVLDTNANIILFNKFAEKLTAYKKENVLGKNWFDLFIPKQNGNTISKVFRKVLKEMPEVSSYENPVLCKNGHERLISWKNTVLKDETGKISGMLSIGIDITERKQIEESLKNNEHFLNTILDSVQEGISVLDLDLTIQHVNGTMNKWYKQNLPLEGKKCYEVYHNANKPCDPCPTLRCLKSGVAEKNIVRGLPGSPVEWIELFSYPIKKPNSDKVTAVVEFVRDISKRIKTENALKKNEENFRNLVENSFDGILINDIAGRYLYANDRAGEISGYTIKELLKLNVKDLTPPKDKDKIMERIKMRMENDQSPNYFESILICKDGKNVPIGLTVAPTVWENRPAEIVSIRDISERKRAEKVLKKRVHELEIFNEVTVDREIKINELRKEINELLIRSGEKEKYEIVE